MSSEGTIVRRVSKTGKVSFLLRYYIEDPNTGQKIRVNETFHPDSNSKTQQKDAEKELRRLLTQVDEGEHIDPNKLTLGKWIDIWLKDHAEQSVSAKTLERYRELLQLKVKPYIGSLLLKKLDTVHIDSLYAKLRKEGRLTRPKGSSPDAPPVKSGLSEQTILHVHRVLSRALLIAVKKKKVSKNVADDATAPKPKVKRGADGGKRILSLDQAQLKELLLGLKGQEQFALIALAAGTGARRGELLALRWSSIDWEKKELRIERSVEQTRDSDRPKGEFRIRIQFKEPKNESSKRTIGLDQALLDLLRKRWKEQAELLLKFGTRLTTNALLFPRDPLAPDVPSIPGYVSKAFASAAKLLGFPDLRFHDLRHTHATLLLTAGVPVNAVASRLGHSTPVVTLTVYGHVIKRAEEQAVKVAGAMLEGALT